MRGWGRGKWFRVEQAPEQCFAHKFGCRNPPEFGCHGMNGFSCRKHKSACCRPLKLSPIVDTPLMQLGTFVFGNGHRIDDAPEDLLLAAYVHVEARLVRCPHGNARARATERWLGRWARLIDGELARRRA